MQDILETIKHLLPLFRSLLLDNAVVIIVTAFLLCMLMNGYRRGLMARIISLGSVLVTLVVEIRFYPALIGFLSSHTAWQELFRSFGRSFLFDRTARQYSPLYQLLGLDLLAENAGEMIGEVALKVLLFLALFIVIRLLLKAASLLVRGLRHIGVIRWLDSWLGAVLGLVEGLLHVWLAMFVLAGFPNFVYTRMILDQIMHNRFLFILYNENLITQLAAGILGFLS